LRRGATWWSLLVLHAVLVHGLTQVLRPTTSYRALELGVSPAWLGVVAASFALAPLFVAVLVSRSTDRRGTRPVLLAGSALMAVATVGFALAATSLAWLVLWSAVLGLGHLLAMVGGQALVAHTAAPGRYDSAFGYYALGASLGQALGPGMVVLLTGSAVLPDTGRIFTAAALLAGGLVVATLALPSEARESGARAPVRASFAQALRVPSLGRAVLASLVVLAAVDLLVIYLPALGVERGIAASTIGMLLVVRAIASMASRAMLGLLVARFGRGRVLTGSIGASALALTTVPLPMPVWAAVVAMAAAGLALGVGQPLTMAWVAQAAPPHVRATALALRLTGNRIGQTVLPATVGLVAAGAGAAGVLWTTAATLGAVAVTTARGSTGSTSEPT